MDQVLTVKLNNGVKVYAAKSQYGINAKTYINDTQVKNAHAKLQAQGVKCSIYAPPTNRVVRFIRIED